MEVCLSEVRHSRGSCHLRWVKKLATVLATEEGHPSCQSPVGGLQVPCQPYLPCWPYQPYRPCLPFRPCQLMSFQTHFREKRTWHPAASRGRNLRLPILTGDFPCCPRGPCRSRGSLMSDDCGDCDGCRGPGVEGSYKPLCQLKTKFLVCLVELESLIFRRQLLHCYRHC